MTDYTEADVERLADVLSEAQKRGIKHGSYTLARWILTAWSVEGSTPSTPPARPCGMHYSWQSDGVRLAGTLGPCVLDVGHYVAPHRDEHGNEWSSQGLLVIDPQPADEPVQVPPPVDALLNLVDELHSAARDDDGTEIDRARGNIVMAVRDLWAAGVAEGHGLLDRAVVQEIEQRERAEEIADKLTAAIGRHLGVDFGEHSNLNDPWGRALVALAEADGGKFVKGAYEDGVAEGRRLLDETAATAAAHAYELGIAEGRRQATEERTEKEVRIDVSLDSPEYRRQLLKMIRNGQIVVRGGDHG